MFRLTRVFQGNFMEYLRLKGCHFMIAITGITYMRNYIRILILG